MRKRVPVDYASAGTISEEISQRETFRRLGLIGKTTVGKRSPSAYFCKTNGPRDMEIPLLLAMGIPPVRLIYRANL